MKFSHFLEPLGGDFKNQFWVSSAEDVAFVEKTVGFTLPHSYKQLVSQYGCSYWYGESREIWYAWEKDEYQKPENNVDLFYGANTPSGGYDIVAGASKWLEGKPLLEFASANASDLFFLAEGGSVYFEPPQDWRFPRGPTRKIADSFDQFLENLELRSE